MIRRWSLVLLLLLGAMGLSWGCGTTGPGQCAEGKEFHEPGCGDNNDFKAGCYASCADNKTCPSGTGCLQVNVVPACASANPPCDACGGQAFLCIPQSSSQCPAGQEHHTPGCNTDGGIKIDPGCYTPCIDDKGCPTGKSCKDVDVTPECAKGNGPTQCGACGQTKRLCITN